MGFGVVFPGQGSQSVGMLEALGEAYESVRGCFDEASQVLGYDLWRLCQKGPEDQLNQTQKTQPALLAAGVAVWRVWEETQGSRPVAFAGHSLGEYTALVCAGALSFHDAVVLVARRGELMQAAVPAGQGAMAAILGLDDEAVSAVCEESAQGQVVAPANYNAPGQVVVAGDKQAVDRAVAMATERGARRAVLLAVSAPSHCELMRPAADGLADELKRIEINPPSLPVFHNIDGKPRHEAAEIRQALVEQLYRPVRWVDGVKSLIGEGADVVIEAGPGKVLAGLCKRIDRSTKALAVADPAGLQQARDAVAGGAHG